MSSGFSIHVAKENFKFSAAHFIAYPGFREPLHGHNYQVGVTVEGRLMDTGYVLDFAVVKQATKEIVDRLDERTLIPADSDCLELESRGSAIAVRYGRDEFVLPTADVCLLPIVHTSAEELARYIWSQLHAALIARQALKEVVAMEVSVAEGPGQAAVYRQEIGTI
jgi:6-pyruvoyltetrahydropterin/6-carboxytetrahydropterin synthase